MCWCTVIQAFKCFRWLCWWFMFDFFHSAPNRLPVLVIDTSKISILSRNEIAVLLKIDNYLKRKDYQFVAFYLPKLMYRAMVQVVWCRSKSKNSKSKNENCTSICNELSKRQLWFWDWFLQILKTPKLGFLIQILLRINRKYNTVFRNGVGITEKCEVTSSLACAENKK